MKIMRIFGRILIMVIAVVALALVSCGQKPKEQYGYVYEDAQISLNDGENIIDWGAGTAASSWDRGMVVFTSSGLGVFGIRSVDGSVNIVFNVGGRDTTLSIIQPPRRTAGMSAPLRHGHPQTEKNTILSGFHRTVS